MISQETSSQESGAVMRDHKMVLFYAVEMQCNKPGLVQEAPRAKQEVLRFQQEATIHLHGAPRNCNAGSYNNRGLKTSRECFVRGRLSPHKTYKTNDPFKGF